MRVAVIGSRSCTVRNIGDYLPEHVEEIISGGVNGVDASAKAYALANNISYIEYLPSYTVYGRAAPLKRNEQIVRRTDRVIAFWDGKSRGTAYSIEFAKKIGKEVEVILLRSE